MHAFDGNGQLRGYEIPARGDPMDGAAERMSALQASLWSLPGFKNPSAIGEANPLPSPLWSSKLHTDDEDWRADGFKRSTIFAPYSQQAFNLSASHQAPVPGPTHAPPGDQNTWISNTDGCERLKIENAELAQALLRKNEEVEAAKLATRALAAWTLNERIRQMAEALHERHLREDYEAILRERDEQVVYLLALHQEAKLEHARTLVLKGEAMGRPMMVDDVQEINKMRVQTGLPLIDEYSAPVMAHETDGQNAYALTKAPSLLCGSDEEEDREAEDEEGAYSPPGLQGSTSINEQVNGLIAEEKGRLSGW